ncbi:uncharacterized protein LOC105696291 [Orussus abietinus]|uniref:uncharacterized protein LOC105696291 n=1 Tax=Orussus abietinus TaxID=222816 RepID=UPI000625D0A9|nr:uncharacterized protein LOC105696291 [Orussus abietinus]
MSRLNISPKIGGSLPVNTKLVEPVTAMKWNIAATIAAFCIEYLPQTFLATPWKKFVQLHKYDKEVPVPEKLQLMFTQVQDDLKVFEAYREQLHPFMTVGFDIYHIGYTFFKFGSYIGIPINFTYKRIGEINTNRVSVNSEVLDINHPMAKPFLESLILSESAQKFAFAKEILQSQTMEGVINPSFTAGFVIMMYSACRYLNRSFKLLHQPVLARFTAHGMLGVMVASLWHLQRDLLSSYYDQVHDAQISDLGQEYVEGGLEYCDKMITRYKAAWQFLGYEDEKATDSLPMQWKLSPFNFRLSTRQRKEYFETKFHKLVQEQEMM